MALLVLLTRRVRDAHGILSGPVLVPGVPGFQRGDSYRRPHWGPR